MANANGNSGGAVMRWAVMAILALLLAWMGIISQGSSTHAIKADMIRADRELKTDLTARLNRIEDKLDELIERD